MSEEQYHSTSHCKYLIQYHIIWCPKFRFSVLEGNVGGAIKEILYKICDDYNYHIKALEVFFGIAAVFLTEVLVVFLDVVQICVNIRLFVCFNKTACDI